MLKGKILTNQSTIGIIAPSSYENKTTINRELEFFSSLGFKYKLGNHIYDRCSFFAGIDSNRAEDLMDMFLDSSIDGILCLRGGYGAIRTLPYINKDIIIKWDFGSCTHIPEIFQKRGYQL